MIATPVFPDLAALVADESLYMRRILRDMLTRVGIKQGSRRRTGPRRWGS